MTTVTVDKGQNLWNIVKTNYGLTNSRDIANKVRDVAKANHISNPNSIFKGQKIELAPIQPEAAEAKPSQETPAAANEAPAAEPASAPVSSPIAASAPVSNPADDNMGKKFDDWSIDTAAKTQAAWEDATANAVKFSREHSTPEEEQLRHNYESSEQQKAEDAISKLPEFRFIKPKGVKLNKDIYLKGTGNNDGLMKLSQDSIKNADQNGDSVLSYEEYEQQELDNLAKMPANRKADERIKKEDEEFWQLMAETSTPEELAKMKKEAPSGKPTPEEIKASIKLAFNTIDLDGNGKIDDKEKAVFYAAMDGSDGELNGRISQEGLAGSAAAGNPKYTDAMKKKYNDLYAQLFGAEK